MKVPYLISFIVAAACLSSTPAAALSVQEPTTSAESAVQEYEHARKELCDNGVKIIALMEGVQDRASADAAAEPLRDMMIKHDVLTERFNITPESFRADLEALGISQNRAEQAWERLYQNGFYGSVALAKTFDVPVSAMAEVQPATPEILADLQAALVDAAATCGVELQGGPGTTPDTAWLMPAEDAVALEYKILRALPPVFEMDSQYLCQDDTNGNGRIYDTHVLIFCQGDAIYRAEVWFDISAYWKQQTADEARDPDTTSSYTPEQRQAALQEAVAILKEAYQTVLRVHDKDSADAAVRTLETLSARFGELTDNELDGMEIQELLEALEEAGITEELLEASADKLEEAGFYGSDALKNFSGGFF